MAVYLGTSIGIAIRGNDLEAVCLRGRGRRLRVSGFLRIEDFRARPAAEVAQQYQRFRQQNHALTTSALVALPRGAGLVRTLELPAAVASELHQAVAYQVDGLHPFEEGGVYFDYSLLPAPPAPSAGNGTGGLETSGNGRLRVAVALVEKTTLVQLYEWFCQAGIDVAGFTLSTAVLYQALGAAPFSWQRTQPQLRRPLLLVDHCGEALELLGIAPDGSFYSKELAATASLAREVEFCVAEMRLDPQSSPPLLETGEGIAQTPEAERPALGNMAAGSGWSPERVLEITPHAAPADFHLRRHLVAYAAALPGLERRLPGVAPPPGLRWNLLPAEKRIHRSHWAHTAAYVLAALVLLLGAARVGATWVQDRLYMSWLNSEIRKLEPQVNHLERLDARQQALLVKLEALQKQQQDIVRKLDAWKELTYLIPPTGWLQSLQFADSEVTASGLAESASGILQAINQSAYFQQPEFVTAISKDSEGREVFQIRMRLRQTAVSLPAPSSSGAGGQ